MKLVSGGTVPVGRGSNDWTHLAATFSNKLYVLYMNGQESVRSTDAGVTPYSGTFGYVNLGATGFVGQLKEVRIWRKARSAYDIDQDMPKSLLYSSALIEISYDGGSPNAAYLGRDTIPTEDGYVYDLLHNQ